MTTVISFVSLIPLKLYVEFYASLKVMWQTKDGPLETARFPGVTAPCYPLHGCLATPKRLSFSDKRLLQDTSETSNAAGRRTGKQRSLFKASYYLFRELNHDIV